MRKLLITLAIIAGAIALSVFEVHRLAIGYVWPYLEAAWAYYVAF